ncbi:MAG: EscU/YscU/HrcU family type III secretion system export apparatus switch protein [Lachnospiraceae bacterium]|nr:EscU/YscU/HrcU family type III secretion system export apparatus switch protein [Lachnospiraceae bacterium]
MNQPGEKPKIKQAVALGYDPSQDDAPRIIATGRGAIADRIIEQAQVHDIPIHEDNKLADTLSRLQIGEMIPPELYEVVAEILVFVDAMDKIRAKGNILPS